MPLMLQENYNAIIVNIKYFCKLYPFSHRHDHIKKDASLLIHLPFVLYV